MTNSQPRGPLDLPLHIHEGLKGLFERWNRSEALVSETADGKRPKWSAHQSAFAEELHDLGLFLENHLGIELPRMLMKGLIAALHLADKDETQPFFLSSNAREKLQHDHDNDDADQFRMHAVVIVQLIVDDEISAGRTRGAVRHALEKVARAISRKNYKVSEFTVKDWRYKIGKTSHPLHNQYVDRLAELRKHVASPDLVGAPRVIVLTGEIVPRREKLPVDEILKNLAQLFATIPDNAGGDRHSRD
jgi:hypothetical protein